MEKNNDSIAYLKMCKNPVSSLITEEDYLRWSGNCLKEANAYYEVSFRCKDMMFNDNRNAFLTNVSFACELYLKHLLFVHNIDCRSEHNLYKLFKKLPEKIRMDLKTKYPYGNTSIDKFELELDDIGQAFTIFRCMYERERMAF